MAHARRIKSNRVKGEAGRESLASPRAIFQEFDFYGYLDHLQLLNAWIEHFEKGHRGFSLRTLAKRSGISVSLLSMALSGKRLLTQKVYAQLRPHLGWTQDQERYFELLLTLGTSDHPLEKMVAFDRLAKSRAFQNRNPKELEVIQYLSHWYYVAIREMAALNDFEEDPEWIQKRLRWPVGVPQIREAVQFLVAQGLLERNSDGRLLPPNRPIQCAGGVYRLALGQFHREMLNLTAESIQQASSSERLVLGHTFVIPQGQHEKARAILLKAQEDLRALGATNGDDVYHAVLSLVPLTHQKISKGGDGDE